MPHTVLLVIGVAVMSGGAAVVIDRSESWPDYVPSRAYYERVWQSDARLRKGLSCEQYLAGVLRFYSGSFLAPGWTQRQARILEDLPPLQARLVEPELAQIGQLLASEWSRLPAATIALWDRTLKDARDADRLAPVLQRIRDDVRALVDGSLDPATVTVDRYSPAALTREGTR